VADRRTGECLLSCIDELSLKLCCFITPDSVKRLETDKAEMSELFIKLSRDIDAALENLTGRLMASSKYENCLDDIEMWLTKAEMHVEEISSRVKLRQDPAIQLEQMQALLMELGGNWEKLDQCGKCCTTAEDKQSYDGFCERYKDLTKGLKVSTSAVLHHCIFIHIYICIY